MTIVIDPDFSVYHLVGRIRQTSTMISHRRTMNIMSYEIEDATRVHRSRGRIFASFQLMSKFIPQMDRYKEIARNAEHVYVFGVPDVVLPELDNITYVKLAPADQLSREWFVVNHGREFHSVLATEELSDVHDRDTSRLFHGLWTFDVDMVRIIEEWLSSAVDANPLNIGEDEYNFQRQTEIMSHTMERLLNMRDWYEDGSKNRPVITAQVKSAVKSVVQPELNARKPSLAPDISSEREAVILFSDLRDFTKLSEEISPQMLVDNVLNPYIKIVTEAVLQHGGRIDKFLGDGILAIFGDDGCNKVDNALQAAIEALSNLRMYHSDFPVGFGLACGEVMIGEIGSSSVRENTVIGDAVNVAQRLSSLGYNGIWVSDSIYNNLSSANGLESVGEFSLKGKSTPHTVYRYNEALVR
jgi:class 3 adenylate cyclase/DICT domain-containing protein